MFYYKLMQLHIKYTNTHHHFPANLHSSLRFLWNVISQRQSINDRWVPINRHTQSHVRCVCVYSRRLTSFHMAEHSCTNSTDDSNWGTENDVSRHQAHTHTHTHTRHVLFMHTHSLSYADIRVEQTEWKQRLCLFLNRACLSGGS